VVTMASALDNQSKLAARLSKSGTRPATVDAFSLPFQPGEVIGGKYKIIRLIGTGGVGFVVSARHVGFDEVVALKFLRPEFATHTEAVTRFTIEARASFKIKSEHVARVLDVDTLPDGTPFIAMEFLEGTDLRRLLDRCRMLAVEPAVDCALQTCEALAAAHALQIIHRDIKPENLFLTGLGLGAETDMVKVLDFGISKVALTGSRRQTHQALTRVAVGTPPYMSPEQVRASSDLDARSDIWSVGCVLYELLTGTAPFDRLSLMQSCAAVLEEDPVPVRDLRQALSPELEAVVMACLQKDPAARYQDVAQLAEALAPFGSGRLVGYPERCRAALSGDGRRSTPSNLVPRMLTGSSHPAPRALTNPPLRRVTGGQRPGAELSAEFAQPQRRLPSGIGPAAANLEVYGRVLSAAAASPTDAQTSRPTLLLDTPIKPAPRRWLWPLAFGVGASLAFGTAYRLSHAGDSAPRATIRGTAPTLAGSGVHNVMPLALPTAAHPAVTLQPVAPGPAPVVARAPIARAPIAPAPASDTTASAALPVPPPSAASQITLLRAAEDVADATLPKGVSASPPIKPKTKSRSLRTTKSVTVTRASDEPDVGF
jgi:serine/threonine protein kinase